MPEELPNVLTLTSDQLAQVALSTIRAVLGSDRYQYLSGPITGGRRLLDWHLGGASSDVSPAGRRRAVEEANIEALRVEATKQRSMGRPTIEPGSFEAQVAGWGQREFLAFWDRVIERHAATVRLLDGWEFSAGCAFEYARAARHGVTAFNELGNPVALVDALALIDAALVTIDDAARRPGPGGSSLVALHGRLAEQRAEVARLRP